MGLKDMFQKKVIYFMEMKKQKNIMFVTLEKYHLILITPMYKISFYLMRLLMAVQLLYKQFQVLSNYLMWALEIQKFIQTLNHLQMMSFKPILMQLKPFMKLAFVIYN